MLSERNSRRGLVAFIVATILALVLGLTVGASNSSNSKTVPLGKPGNPCVGNQCNTHPVLSTVQSWPDLVQAAKHNTAYQSCLQNRIGVSWEQAQQYAALVKQGYDLRAILVSNEMVSDDQARKMLAKAGIHNTSDLKVIRVGGFENTMSLPKNGCLPFDDERSQVRLTLTVPIDVKHVLQKGVYQDRGVLGLCSNPWNKPHRPKLPPTPLRSPKPTPSKSCMPTPGVEVCKQAAFAPPFTRQHPVRTPPPGGYCPRPVTPTSACSSTPYSPTPDPTSSGSVAGQGDSGSGATNTTSSPSTSSSGPAPDNTAAPSPSATVASP